MAHQPGSPSPPTAPLVCHEREQAAPRDALAAALAGRGSLVLIGGEAGIGKNEASRAKALKRGVLAPLGRSGAQDEPPSHDPGALADSRGRDTQPALTNLGGEGGVVARAAFSTPARDFPPSLAVRRTVILLPSDLHRACQGADHRARGRP